MKNWIPSNIMAGWLILAMAMPLVAQEDIPLLRPEEKAVLDDQSREFNKAIGPVMQEAAKSTVRIWESRRLAPGKYLAYGTVIGDGKRIVTKWSELLSARPDLLIVQSADGDAMAATIEQVHPEEDLAVLSIKEKSLKPVTWSDVKPPLGSFMAAPQPDGQLAGFGVLSVNERSLRETDQAFLGVTGDISFDGPGVMVREVSEGSGAAKAGIVAGDIILKVGVRAISGVMELRNALLPIGPGEEVTLMIKRNNQAKELRVVLGNRPEFPNFLGRRLQQMERMGTRVSRVRDSFSSAIQTDMGLQPNQVGGPVVNLKGEVIGITIARADRTRSFVMSATAVRDLLKQQGKNPKLALAELRQQQQDAPVRRPPGQLPPRGAQPSPDQLENHLREMRRLMRLMQDEMDALER